MEIAEIMEFCTQFDIGGKILDIVIIILYLCGKKKTAEELQAKKEKRLEKQKAKAEKALAKAQAEVQKEAEMAKEINEK